MLLLKLWGLLTLVAAASCGLVQYAQPAQQGQLSPQRLQQITAPQTFAQTQYRNAQQTSGVVAQAQAVLQPFSRRQLPPPQDQPQYADPQQYVQQPQQATQPQQYAQQPQQYAQQPQQYVQQPQQYAQPQPKLRAAGPPRNQFLPQPEDYDPNPQYQFSFDVKDDQFTNYQNRKESREGDKISGSYSVVDSDGFIRTVKYTADPLEGFKAEVTREPTDIVVKLPQPLQPAPSSLAAGPGSGPSQRQHQTQQYLEAAPFAQPQHPPAQVYSSVSQNGPRPQHLPNLGRLPQYSAAPSSGQQYQLAPAPKALKAGALGFASQQPAGGNVVYQAYQQ